ncbi:hypothetical protein NB723_003474 [Xanthomonas sacchari]|nr:hypothetical protein [Xanthomonas sacchari]
MAGSPNLAARWRRPRRAICRQPAIRHAAGLWAGHYPVPSCHPPPLLLLRSPLAQQPTRSSRLTRTCLRTFRYGGMTAAGRASGRCPRRSGRRPSPSVPAARRPDAEDVSSIAPPRIGRSRRRPRRSVGKFCNIALAQSRSPRYDARPRTGPAALRSGRVAQLVEQGIENPRVGGSIPSSATILSGLAAMQALFFCREGLRHLHALGICMPWWCVVLPWSPLSKVAYGVVIGRPGRSPALCRFPHARGLLRLSSALIGCEEGVSTFVDNCTQFTVFRDLPLNQRRWLS